MSDLLAVYDLEAVDAIVMALSITHLRGIDTFLEIEHPEQYTEVEGADGNVIVCRTNQKIYKVAMTLLSSSKHTAQLYDLHRANTIVKNGAGIGAFMVKDNNGQTLSVAEYCWIKQAPKRVIGRLVKEETWNLIVVAEVASMGLGGNIIE
jgi:uncharacterized protein (UPF0254 family)